MFWKIHRRTRLKTTFNAVSTPMGSWIDLVIEAPIIMFKVFAHEFMHKELMNSCIKDLDKGFSVLEFIKDFLKIHKDNIPFRIIVYPLTHLISCCIIFSHYYCVKHWKKFKISIWQFLRFMKYWMEQKLLTLYWSHWM